MGEQVLPTERLGPYRVLRSLGSGAMGTVYLAEGEEGERVALKVVHPHLLERRGFFRRFEREAEAGKRVDHPNVVRTHRTELQVVGGTPYCFLVMEYVEGRTLRALLEDLGTVPEALVREIARQAAEGLQAIHEAGVVHRDVKPENVLITDDHRVRIMDLGVARIQDASVGLTKEGQFAGSLLYAAPEQLKKGTVGPAADLYALGVVLHELATGRAKRERRGTSATSTWPSAASPRRGRASSAPSRSRGRPARGARAARPLEPQARTHRGAGPFGSRARPFSPRRRRTGAWSRATRRPCCSRRGTSAR